MIPAITPDAVIVPRPEHPRIRRSLVVIPVLLLLHNTEEALTMPGWMIVHLEMLRSTLPFFSHLRFSPVQLYTSLTQLSILPVLLSIVCLTGPLTRRKMMTMLLMQSIIFWNALMPHLLGTIVLGMYNPGMVTATILTIPYSVWLWRRVRKENVLEGRELKSVLLWGAGIYLPIVYLNHLLAHAVSGS